MNRTECKYNINCYRENLQHILDYSHNDFYRERFNKIIKTYKITKYNRSDSLYIYKSGRHFGMILWVLENHHNFSSDEKNIIKRYFTTLEEEAMIDPILNTRNRKEDIRYNDKYITIQKLWETELCNTIVIFSIE
jgi:hypothetical protein